MRPDRKPDHISDLRLALLASPQACLSITWRVLVPWISVLHAARVCATPWRTHKMCMATPTSGLDVAIGRACTRPLLCGERPAGPRGGWGARAGWRGWWRGCSLTCVPRYCRVSGDKGGQWDPLPARPVRPGRFQARARLQAGSSSLARVSCAHLLEEWGPIQVTVSIRTSGQPGSAASLVQAQASPHGTRRRRHQHRFTFAASQRGRNGQTTGQRPARAREQRAGAQGAGATDIASNERHPGAWCGPAACRRQLAALQVGLAPRQEAHDWASEVDCAFGQAR